ncbi:hypothetical protein RFI_09491, partial [Reticulomyxa filosa]
DHTLLKEKGGHSDAKTKPHTLATVFQHDYLFSAYMAHLFQEFSIDLIEWVQFKDLLRQRYSDKIKQGEIKFGEGLLYLQNIPKSNIVYGTMSKEEKQNITNISVFQFRHKAMQLYAKYIPLDGEFTVNISNNCRRNLESVINNPNSFRGDDSDAILLFTLFDQCIDEVYTLQEDDSFTRFRRSEVYQALIRRHGISDSMS